MTRIAGVVLLLGLGIFALVWAALEVLDAWLGGDGLRLSIDDEPETPDSLRVGVDWQGRPTTAWAEPPSAMPRR